MPRLFLLGLIVSSAAAAQTVTPVASVDDVQAMCSSADPGRFFVVDLPSGGFSFAPYDASRARVVVDAGKGLSVGGFELVLHDIAGVAPIREGGLDIAVPASSSEAAVLLAAHARGEVGLKLTFQLAAPLDGSAVCASVVRTNGEGVRAAIEPMAFELTRGSVPIASGESGRFAAAHELPAAVVSPRVVVSAPMLTAVGGRAPAKVARAATALGPRLLECYRLGLDGDPTLRGPFVAAVDMSADGRVASARAELDGIGDPAVTGCVLRLVRAARFPAGGGRFSIPMTFTD